MREKKLYSSAHFKYINSLDSFYKHVLKFLTINNDYTLSTLGVLYMLLYSPTVY